MPRRTRSVPLYRKHRVSGQAIVTLNGRNLYLGPHGSIASRDECDGRLDDALDGDGQPAERFRSRIPPPYLRKFAGRMMCSLDQRRM